jgi:S1-C subfamily serine protease
MSIVDELRSGEAIGTGYLGVQTTPVRLPTPAGDASHGLLVTGVEDDSPAQRAGLSVGTFITTVGTTMVTGVEDLYDALTGLRAGSVLPVTVADASGQSSTLEVEVVLRG